MLCLKRAWYKTEYVILKYIYEFIIQIALLTLICPIYYIFIFWILRVLYYHVVLFIIILVITCISSTVIIVRRKFFHWNHDWVYLEFFLCKRASTSMRSTCSCVRGVARVSAYFCSWAFSARRRRIEYWFFRCTELYATLSNCTRRR